MHEVNNDLMILLMQNKQIHHREIEIKLQYNYNNIIEKVTTKSRCSEAERDPVAYFICKFLLVSIITSNIGGQTMLFNRMRKPLDQ